LQQIEGLDDELKAIYRTVWEVPMRSLIDMARDRNAYIDQSQSLNLFAESPNIGRLSSMYMYAWKQGLKTTYYLRIASGDEDCEDNGAEVCDEWYCAGSKGGGGSCGYDCDARAGNCCCLLLSGES